MHKTKRSTKTKHNKTSHRMSKFRKTKHLRKSNPVRKTKHLRKSNPLRKSKSLRKSNPLRGGSIEDDELIEKMERGESGFLPKGKKINFLPGKPLLEKFYSKKTEKEKRLDEFHKRMRLEEQAYLADLEARDRYLRDPRTNALESRESYFRRPELVDYQIDKKTGELKQTFKATRGLDFGLNEEKDGPPQEGDWGFYALDFRGGKRRKK